jgi:hypothetical protein
MNYLPLDGVLDTVYFHDGFVPLKDLRKVKTEDFKRRTRSRILCNHEKVSSYVHRPGSFADNFEGEACVACGKIFTRIQTL